MEFAIISILLFMILFGIIQFGIALSKVNVYTGAAREGARFAAVRCEPSSPCDPGEVQARVTDAAVGYPITGPVTVTVGGAAANGCTRTTVGQQVRVSWDQRIQMRIPYVPGMNPVTITRHIEGVFRCE